MGLHLLRFLFFVWVLFYKEWRMKETPIAKFNKATFIMNHRIHAVEALKSWRNKDGPVRSVSLSRRGKQNGKNKQRPQVDHLNWSMAPEDPRKHLVINLFCAVRLSKSPSWGKTGRLPMDKRRWRRMSNYISFNDGLSAPINNNNAVGSFKWKP